MQPISQILSFGNDNPQIAIITGANKAGKSTSLCAYATAVVLAQTLAIVPATHCILTPFASIKTGFNMTARVNHGQSLFSASIDFAHDILDYARAKKGSHILVIVDELFNSTDFEKGCAIVQKFAQELQQCPSCIALIATHFASLTELEEENPHKFKNYKAEYLDQLRYQIIPGISDAHHVLSLAGQSVLL